MDDLGIILLLAAHLVVIIWMQFRIERDLSEALGRRDGWAPFGFGRDAMRALSAINHARSIPVDECPLCHRRKVQGMNRCSCGAAYGEAMDADVLSELRKRCSRQQQMHRTRVVRKSGVRALPRSPEAGLEPAPPRLNPSRVAKDFRALLNIPVDLE